jgi:hypothetical protein
MNRKEFIKDLDLSRGHDVSAYEAYNRVVREYDRLKAIEAENNYKTEVVKLKKADQQKSKDLYAMNLGDSIILESLHIKWLVTRVPSGWIYSNITRDANQSVFVPFDNAVQNPFKP